MQTSSAHARARMAHPRAGRVLAILSDDERRDFLPPTLECELAAIADELAIAPPPLHGTDGLATLLEGIQPRALVTCWQTPPLPKALPASLRYVCHLCGSVKRLVSQAHLAGGLLVTNWGDSVSRVVAEGALLHMLACLRRASHWAVTMHRDGAWKPAGAETASLFGRAIGLHGFGGVARELVRLLRPFDLPIQVFAPDIDAHVERTYGVRGAPSLEALFADNEIVVEIAPLNSATRASVTEKHLRLLRPGAVFINVGRGAVVDEAALIRVAREGRVQFGLDVFAAEPLTCDHPLRGLPNVTLTPHVAGPTPDRRCDAGAHAVRNLRAFAAGEPLDAVITPAIYEASS